MEKIEAVHSWENMGLCSLPIFLSTEPSVVSSGNEVGYTVNVAGLEMCWIFTAQDDIGRTLKQSLKKKRKGFSANHNLFLLMCSILQMHSCKWHLPFQTRQIFSPSLKLSQKLVKIGTYENLLMTHMKAKLQFSLCPGQKRIFYQFSWLVFKINTEVINQNISRRTLTSTLHHIVSLRLFEWIHSSLGLFHLMIPCLLQCSFPGWSYFYGRYFHSWCPPDVLDSNSDLV